MVSFFDFIVAANGKPLKDVDGTFIELIKEYEDKQLPLTLYNIKNHSTRDITLTPSRNWPGEGMLGVTIRFDSFYKAEVLAHELTYWMILRDNSLPTYFLTLSPLSRTIYHQTITPGHISHNQ